ncbi:MAG: prolyl oligopeptidase family serine peptidase, partial [Chitinophagaceae bacterium]|nr:prolyl oligopeptidase family serine peptidase [Chitinophagaceae bacterium]
VYPVISMKAGLTHTGSRINLLGTNPTEEKVKFFSSEENITPKTPPTYITHAGDDNVVDVENSIQMYRWLQMEGVDAELHIFPKGNHGFTQRMPTNEWLDPMLTFLKSEGFYQPHQTYN